jgi:cob(I)alamin adenosyltransferase
MSIYTRTGDDGSTALYGGKRVGKDDPHVEFYGGMDELNSYLGLITSLIQERKLQKFIQSIQCDLMEVSALAAGASFEEKFFSARIKEFEVRIDLMGESVKKLHTFLLPGGSKEGSMIHIARSICRGVERQAVRAHLLEFVPYLNRLSDYLFTLARFINIKAGKEEIQWKNDILQKRKT